MVTATPKSPGGTEQPSYIERLAHAFSGLLRNTNRTTGAEALADFGGLRGAESAALPRYYTHGIRARYYTHGITRTVLHARYTRNGNTRGWKDYRTDLAAEMLPASGLEFVRDAAAIAQEDFASARDVTDLGDRHARDSRWYGSIAGCGEQEFVIFAAVQSEFEIDFMRWFANAGSRNEFRFHFGAHTAFFANVGEVGGKAITGVDHGRGQGSFAKHAAEFDSRLGKKMPRILCGVHLPLGLLRRPPRLHVLQCCG